jgi:signal transduction histidine kinase
LFIVANNFFLVSALVAGGSVTYLLEQLFRHQFLVEKELMKEREALAHQSQNDSRYLAWLRQLAEFLRHEVRHPVAQINSSIELAQLASKDDDRIAPYLASAALSSQHVWNLIERASQATDAEAFVRQLHLRPTDLRMFLIERVEAFRHSSAGVGFALTCPDLIQLRLDTTLMKEAIDNLLGNAVSFADEGSTVEVGARIDGGRVVVSVKNRGPLVGDDTEAWFGPFASSRSGPSGVHQGLGLYLVRLIAEQHGGTATLANLEDGSGVVASILLPRESTPRIPSDSRGHAPI